MVQDSFSIKRPGTRNILYPCLLVSIPNQSFCQNFTTHSNLFRSVNKQFHLRSHGVESCLWLVPIFGSLEIKNQTNSWSELTSSIFHFTIYRSLPKMNLRIEIFMLKVVYTENLTMFGLSGCKLRRFENVVFPIH